MAHPTLYSFKEKENYSVQCNRTSIGKIGLHGNQPYSTESAMQALCILAWN